MMFPARMKKGIASNAKLLSPVAMRCEKVATAGMKSMLTSMVKIPEIPRLKATGTPMMRRRRKLNTSTKISKYSIALIFSGFH